MLKSADLRKRKQCRKTKTDRDKEQLMTMPFLPCTILTNKTVESKLELFFLNTVSPFSPDPHPPPIEALENFEFTPEIFQKL